MPKPQNDSKDSVPVEPRSTTTPSSETNVSIGPVIPVHLLQQSNQEPNVEEEDSDDDAYGPALPPDMLKERGVPTTKKRPVGPSLPTQYDLERVHESDDDDFMGPEVPTGDIDEESGVYDTIRQIENRVNRTTEHMEPGGEEDSGPQKRGEWMLVPPKNKSLADALKAPEALMRPRTFSTKTTEMDTDSSEWTETPAERAARRREGKDKKRKHPVEEEPRVSSNRDKKIREEVHKHNKEKRPKTLMEMHAETVLKSKKYQEEDSTKRPFDRERDLNARQVNPANLKDRLTKAGALGSRFSGSRNGSYM